MFIDNDKVEIAAIIEKHILSIISKCKNTLNILKNNDCHSYNFNIFKIHGSM